MVVGDVNATMACTIAAKKLNLRVAHLEAGLRSRDRSMPEEVNRIVTDALADLLWTPSSDADANLLSEGVPRERINFVGNIMIDSFELQRDRIEGAAAWKGFGVEPGKYAVVTLHRPVNVDDRDVLSQLVGELCNISVKLPLVFPVHPRTMDRLRKFDLLEKLRASGIRLGAPLGYIQFMSLLKESTLAITDSGGLQEETTYMGVPCLTLRDSTERPVTVTEGSNELIKKEQLRNAVDIVCSGKWKEGHIPKFWDGKTASRVVASLKSHSAH